MTDRKIIRRTLTKYILVINVFHLASIVVIRFCYFKVFYNIFNSVFFLISEQRTYYSSQLNGRLNNEIKSEELFHDEHKKIHVMDINKRQQMFRCLMLLTGIERYQNSLPKIFTLEKIMRSQGIKSNNSILPGKVL